MLNQTKALIAKGWKNQKADLPVGKHEVNETLLVRVRGQVEKHDDQMIAPTVSIPLISVLAYFWEKAGIERDAAMEMLRTPCTKQCRRTAVRTPPFKLVSRTCRRRSRR